MKYNPLVSIIVPIYNSQKYLDISINSLLNQTYSNLEIILIDDGSADNSLEMCYHYAKMDKRIIVKSQFNKGASEARNHGIEYMNGEFFMFIDSDDWIERNMVEELLSEIVQYNGDIALCGLTIDYLDINGKTKESKFIKPKKEVLFNNHEFPKNILYLFEGELINGPCCKLIKSEIVRKNSIKMNPKLQLQEDLDFNLNILTHVNCLITSSAPFYHYNIREEESITTRYYSDRFEMLNYVHNKVVTFYVERTNNTLLLEGIYFLYIKNLFSSSINLFHQNCTLSLKEKYSYLKTIYNKAEHKLKVKKANKKGLKYKMLKLTVSTNNVALMLIISFLLKKVKENTRISW